MKSKDEVEVGAAVEEEMASVKIDPNGIEEHFLQWMNLIWPRRLAYPNLPCWWEN